VKKTEFKDIQKFISSGSWKCDYHEKLNMNPDFQLQTEEEVLTWYLQHNDGGTPHTESEISRVKEVLNDMK